MSTPKNKDDVINNKKEAIRELNNLLERYICEQSAEHLKKADLISYWIKDYSRMILREDTINSKKFHSFKRGSVVKLHFGFNPGAEYGGLHYGIVLDKKDRPINPVLTVVPLTSCKDESKVHSNNIYLGNEIYTCVENKFRNLKQQTLTKYEELNSLICTLQENVATIEELVLNSDESKTKELLESNKILLSDAEQKRAALKKEQELANKIMLELNHMKQGSVAIINQVTTVSKLRVYDPKSSSDVLSNVVISKANIQRINDKLKDLYIF